MKVKELIQEKSNSYYDYEVFAFTDKRHSVHGDFIKNIDYDHNFEEYQDCEVSYWEIMDEKRYDESILANSCEKANFGEWYDDSNAKILVIILDENWKDQMLH